MFLTNLQKLLMIYALQAYLTMSSKFQNLMWNLGENIDVNRFTFWFIVVSFMCLITLVYAFRTDFVFSKPLLVLLLLRNTVAILPIFFPKLYYMFYNGEGAASVPYLPSWFTPFKHLFYLEIFVLTVGGLFGNKIVNRLRNSNIMGLNRHLRSDANLDEGEKYVIHY
jgi:hypothetical protein